MKFLIVKPSPLPMLIPLGPKYSPQDPVYNTIVKKYIVTYGSEVGNFYSNMLKFW